MHPPNHGCLVTVFMRDGARLTGWLSYDLAGAPNRVWTGLQLNNPSTTPTSIQVRDRVQLVVRPRAVEALDRRHGNLFANRGEY